MGDRRVERAARFRLCQRLRRHRFDGHACADPFGAFSNHLGNPPLGSAGDGDAEGHTILGHSGLKARTYTLAPAGPEPETWALMLGGLGWLGGLAGRRERPAR